MEEAARTRQVWMLCDAPSVLYALIKLGLVKDARVQKAVSHLAGLSLARAKFRKRLALYCLIRHGKIQGARAENRSLPLCHTAGSESVFSTAPVAVTARSAGPARKPSWDLWEQAKGTASLSFCHGNGFCQTESAFHLV